MRAEGHGRLDDKRTSLQQCTMWSAPSLPPHRACCCSYWLQTPICPRGALPVSVVDEFMDSYDRLHDFHLKVAEICADQCIEQLRQLGIKAIVSRRVKEAERLRNKLHKEHGLKEFRTAQEISDRISDIIGVRIALYFPGVHQYVQEMLLSQFDVQSGPKYVSIGSALSSREDSYEKRFSGYRAVHYRVRLHSRRLGINKKHYGSANIEIQVMSMFMHSWAEIEHDMIYKPLSGEIDDEQRAIIDQLNGLIQASEIAVELLQKSLGRRDNPSGVGFDSHSSLASRLRRHQHDAGVDVDDEHPIGDTQSLFQLLQEVQSNDKSYINDLLMYVRTSTFPGPLASQVSSTMVNTLPRALFSYLELHQGTKDSTFHMLDAQERAYAVGCWNAFTTAVEETVRDQGLSLQWRDVRALTRELSGFPQHLAPTIEKARVTTIRAVEGRLGGEVSELLESARLLQGALKAWRVRAPQATRPRIDSALATIPVWP